LSFGNLSNWAGRSTYPSESDQTFDDPEAQAMMLAL
jgi:hypothetical protein